MKQNEGEVIDRVDVAFFLLGMFAGILLCGLVGAWT